MRVRLVGSDDVLPDGKLTVNLDALPRVDELVVWQHSSIDPPDYFRVTEVCHIVSGPMNEPCIPEVQLEYIGHAP
ncbi:hypothetical protein A5717_26110 [Mycolicibacterium porcinum]|uniref:hypothetical protein n=1 Tax=Mycolicibacterium porcinum TaxID=39693 RepID=UPI00080B1F93|nr:hypothetical protein [Mycolicibacterium porcinum]OCB09252.1 hypothetical protein A5717_26110 [Mycolicibacterium porcinum]